MQRRSQNERIRIAANDLCLNRNAVWSGYGEPYVKNIVKGALKALKLLSALTFDPGLFFWTKGLEAHLTSKMQEAEKEKAEIKKYTF
jgi:hypothetical protein